MRFDRLGWRCPAEPVADYVRKGGDVGETIGRKCICNALLANIGVGQIREHGLAEQPLVTSGDDIATVASFLKAGASSYSAADVVADLLQYAPQAGSDTRSGDAARRDALSVTQPQA